MEQEIEGSKSAPRPWRIARPVGIAAVAAIAVAVIFVGSAAASPIVLAPATTKYGPPYSGTGLGVLGLLGTGCGGSASASVLPTFNLTTGIGLASAKVGAHACGSANTSEEAFVEVGLLGPQFTTTAGTHNVTANWTLHFAESLTATPGGSTPAALAECDVSAYTYVEDTTNGSSFFLIHNPIGFKEITTGTYAKTYSKVKLTAWVDGKFVAKHDYQFELEIEFELGVEAGAGTNSASASINMGTGSNGATLASVVFI